MELFDQDIKQYLINFLKVELATSYWLKGYVCLRCHEYGVLTIETFPNSPWCTLCGKDPLFHGPELPKRKIKPEGVTNF